MQNNRIDNVNIVSEKLLPTPAEVKIRLPLSPKAEEAVYYARQQIRAILDRRDPRMLMIVGPCSIHNVGEALKYAHKLKALSNAVSRTLMLIMRVYFEKPRTSVGWKGFINDPYLDDSFRIDEGIHKARVFLIELAEMGLPAGTEALDPIAPQYIGDLISWTAIGARTTESQTHREMASGLSTPVGFKNSTDGNIDAGINAIKAARESHHFLGITEQGQSAVFHTSGNPYGHIVLRGGTKPNYDSMSLSLCERKLREGQLPVNIVVDCSHGNSEGNPILQPVVVENCVQQIIDGNNSIVGFMVESNLLPDSQPIPELIADLKPGVSVTDPCIDWPTTEEIIREAHDALRNILQKRSEQAREIHNP